MDMDSDIDIDTDTDIDIDIDMDLMRKVSRKQKIGKLGIKLTCSMA